MHYANQEMRINAVLAVEKNWYRKATNQVFADAEYNLGVMHMKAMVLHSTVYQ